MPFTGDSSDDSSDGEEHSVMMTTHTVSNSHNSHNSSSTEHTETSTSNSASSPTKSLKTSSSLSPAKKNGPESPKNKPRGTFEVFQFAMRFFWFRVLLVLVICLWCAFIIIYNNMKQYRLEMVWN